MTIKQLCRQAGVAKVDAGDEGAVLSFHKESADPQALVAFIAKQAGNVKLRPDHSLVIPGHWSDVDERLKGVRKALSDLAEIVVAGA
jgi:transcription-repair coupling factor (superfamily II helicase)